jgi:hypothetical protein
MPARARATATGPTIKSAAQPLKAAAIEKKNPLKDAKRIQDASKAAARQFVESGKPFAGSDWSRAVLERMGFTKWAYNDQGTRTRLHARELKLSAFKAAGVDEKWLDEHTLGSGAHARAGPLPPAVPVALPELPAEEPPSKPSVPSAADLQVRLSAAERTVLEEDGVLRIAGLLSKREAREVLLALGADKRLLDSKPEQKLRASTGSGCGGGYTTIVKQPPALGAACDALRGWLSPPPGDSQDKCLLLRYAAGGVNWAHQDQSASPWQAVLLLNPPSEFEGGALYVVDAAKEPLTRREVPFESEGDVIVFAANSSAPGGRQLYHGMSEVRRGQRFAVGMFQ